MRHRLFQSSMIDRGSGGTPALHAGKALLRALPLTLIATAAKAGIVPTFGCYVWISAQAPIAADPISMSPFRQSVEAMIPALRRYARALARDADIADDLVQDTLVRALRSEKLFL